MRPSRSPLKWDAGPPGGLVTTRAGGSAAFASPVLPDDARRRPVRRSRRLPRLPVWRGHLSRQSQSRWPFHRPGHFRRPSRPLRRSASSAGRRVYGHAPLARLEAEGVLAISGDRRLAERFCDPLPDARAVRTLNGRGKVKNRSNSFSFFRICARLLGSRKSAKALRDDGEEGMRHAFRASEAKSGKAARIFLF